jgi:hypothetical protein
VKTPIEQPSSSVRPVCSGRELQRVAVLALLVVARRVVPGILGLAREPLEVPVEDAGDGGVGRGEPPEQVPRRRDRGALVEAPSSDT